MLEKDLRKGVMVQRQDYYHTTKRANWLGIILDVGEEFTRVIWLTTSTGESIENDLMGASDVNDCGVRVYSNSFMLSRRMDYYARYPIGILPAFMAQEARLRYKQVMGQTMIEPIQQELSLPKQNTTELREYGVFHIEGKLDKLTLEEARDAAAQHKLNDPSKSFIIVRLKEEATIVNNIIYKELV